MALQSSGFIDMSDIQTEFVDAGSGSLSEFYGAATGIPSSGAIKFSDFYGKSNITPITSVAGTGGTWTENNGNWSVTLNVGPSVTDKTIIIAVWREHAGSNVTVGGRSCKLLASRAAGVGNYIEIFGLDYDLTGNQTVSITVRTGDSRRTAACAFYASNVDLNAPVEVKTGAGSLSIQGKVGGAIFAGACNRYSPTTSDLWAPQGFVRNYYSNQKGEGYWSFGSRKDLPSTGSYTVPYPFSGGSYANLVAVSLTGKT
jgi:hypothetical protein